MKVPRIAIPETLKDMTNYVYAMHFLGADPVVVSSMDMAGKLGYLQVSGFRVLEFDGLILPGGADINPSRYGQENTASNGINDELDALQFLLLDAFVSHRKPVFGICMGHQLINVYFGGTLAQDLPMADKHARDIPASLHPDKVHLCRCAENSWIQELYGTEFFSNSAHHQAVGVPGKDLVIDARCCLDESVEAMHHAALPVWSVQFHPERMCFANRRPDTEDGAAVLNFFIHKCL